ncbi:MAG: indole-3-glycerol-phosphate synthase [Methanolinea sp.]|jgi:indole-3-glycerol phosphate synthase|nr:indole-3-glycerol-phosphate synthase [Methanolinea sp.]
MILEEILAATGARVSDLPEQFSEMAQGSRVGNGLFEAMVQRDGRNAIISEIKYASPSRGVIRAGDDPVKLARMMVSAGCSALSVITEPSFFHGHPGLIPEILPHVDVPILRKDFIIDERQMAETRALGADAVLLITAVLGDRLADFVEMASHYSLEPLVEVHTAEEVSTALDSGTRLVGINNRNLKDLTIDLSTTRRLAPLVRDAGCRVVSESGFVWPYDVRSMRKLVDGFLIGSSIMSARDPEKRLGGFVSA